MPNLLRRHTHFKKTTVKTLTLWSKQHFRKVIIFCFFKFTRFVLLESMSFVTVNVQGRKSVVVITISYELADRGVGVRVPVVSIIFLLSFRPALGSTQPPPNQWVKGASFSGYIAAEAWSWRLTPSYCVEVKKMWIYTSTPHITSWCSD
jgi:hypothetical protein